MKIFTDTDLSLTPAKNILDSIEVRPILPEEKAKWDELMKAHHYLAQLQNFWAQKACFFKIQKLNM